MSEFDEALNEGLEVLDEADGVSLILTIPGRPPVAIRGTISDTEVAKESDTQTTNERFTEACTLLLLRSQNADLEAALAAVGAPTLITDWRVTRGARAYSVDTSRHDAICHDVQLISVQ
jgi:hypothetical protein